jgi:hypothetical protein
MVTLGDVDPDMVTLPAALLMDRTPPHAVDPDFPAAPAVDEVKWHLLLLCDLCLTLIHRPSFEKF